MVKISVVVGVRGTILLVTVGLIMPLLTILSAVEQTAHTGDNEDAVASCAVTVGAIAVRARLEANQADAKSLSQWARQRFVSQANTVGTIQPSNRTNTRTLYETIFQEKAISQLRPSASCPDCDAPHQGITFYYPAGSTSGLTAAYHSELTSAPRTTGALNWNYIRSNFVSGWSLQSSTLSSTDGGLTVTETASTVTNATLTGLDQTVASLLTSTAQVGGTMSVLKKANPHRQG